MEIDGIEIPGTVPARSLNWSFLYVEVFRSDENLDDITAKLYEAPPEDVPTPMQGGISLNQIEVALPSGQHFVSLMFNQPLDEWRAACIAFCRLEGRCWAEATEKEFHVSNGRDYHLSECRFRVVTEDLQPHWSPSVPDASSIEPRSFPTSAALANAAKRVWKRHEPAREELLSIEPPEDPRQEDALTRRFRHLFAILEETFQESWGRPAVKLKPDPADPEVSQWMDRIGDGFYELVVWKQNGKEQYLALQQADRGCPLIISAGRTL